MLQEGGPGVWLALAAAIGGLLGALFLGVRLGG